MTVYRWAWFVLAAITVLLAYFAWEDHKTRTRFVPLGATIDETGGAGWVWDRDSQRACIHAMIAEDQSAGAAFFCLPERGPINLDAVR